MKIFSNFMPESHHVYDQIKIIGKDKPITFFYDYIPENIDQLKINKYNFIMLHEPNEFFNMHTWVKLNYKLFTGILTWNEDLLNSCPNSILFHHVGGGGCGTEENNYLENFNTEYPNKKFEISFLCGAKKLIDGHHLRQEIFKIKDQIKIPSTKWFYTLNDFNQMDFDNGGIGRPANFWIQKKYCYTESMFNISVENSCHNNWYTEKITDAFATKTVPIYWGCPNISDLGYDERGIIRFNNVDELIQKVNLLTPELYENMKLFIEYNCEMVKYNRLKPKLYEFFKQFIELNNL